MSEYTKLRDQLQQQRIDNALKQITKDIKEGFDRAKKANPFNMVDYLQAAAEQYAEMYGLRVEQFSFNMTAIQGECNIQYAFSEPLETLHFEITVPPGIDLTDADIQEVIKDVRDYTE